MANSVWDFVFKFVADATGIDEGLQKADRAADQLEAALDHVDTSAAAAMSHVKQSADRLEDSLDNVADAAAQAGRVVDRQADNMVRQLSVADRAADSLVGHLRGWAGELAGMAAGALALGSLIGSVSEVTRFSLEMGTLAERSGLAVSTFGALTDEARRLGGEFTESEMFSALERLQTETDDVYGTLDRFQRLASGLDSNAAINLGDELGIDPVLVNVLQQADGTLASLTDRYERLGGLTDENLAQLRLAYGAWQDIRQAWATVLRQIVVALAPALRLVAEGLQRIVGFAAENREVVTGFFIGAAGVITAVYLPALQRAILATGALIAPWLPLLAVIALVGLAVGLLYDDFKTFQRGGDSVIGRLIDKFPELEDTIERVSALMDDLKAIFGDLDGVGELALEEGVTSAFQRIGDVGRRAFEAIGNAFPDYKPLLDVLGQIVDIGYNISGIYIDTLFDVAGSLLKFFGRVLKAIGLLFTSPKEALKELGDAISQLFKDLFEAGEGVFDGLLDAFPELEQRFTQFKDFVMGLFGTIKDTITGAVDSVTNFVKGGEGLDMSDVTAPSVATGDNELPLPPEPTAVQPGNADVISALAAPAQVVPTDAVTQPSSSQVLPGTVAAPEALTALQASAEAGRVVAASVTNTNTQARQTTQLITENDYQQTLTNNRSTTVQVREININTQATDAEGISAALRDEMSAMFAGFDDTTRDGIQHG